MTRSALGFVATLVGFALLTGCHGAGDPPTRMSYASAWDAATAAHERGELSAAFEICDVHLTGDINDPAAQRLEELRLSLAAELCDAEECLVSLERLSGMDRAQDAARFVEMALVISESGDWRGAVDVLDWAAHAYPERARAIEEGRTALKPFIEKALSERVNTWARITTLDDLRRVSDG